MSKCLTYAFLLSIILIRKTCCGSFNKFASYFSLFYCLLSSDVIRHFLTTASTCLLTSYRGSLFSNLTDFSLVIDLFLVFFSGRLSCNFAGFEMGAFFSIALVTAFVSSYESMDFGLSSNVRFIRLEFWAIYGFCAAGIVTSWISFDSSLAVKNISSSCLYD